MSNRCLWTWHRLSAEVIPCGVRWYVREVLNDCAVKGLTPECVLALLFQATEVMR